MTKSLDGYRLPVRDEKMKKSIVTCVVALTALVAVLGCSREPPEPPMIPLLAHQIEAEATLNKGFYLAGEDIVIELSFKNVTSQIFQMEPFPPKVLVTPTKQYGIKIRKFPEGTGTKVLNPAEVANYTLTWDQRDNQGKQVPFGYYRLALGSIHVMGQPYLLELKRPVQLLILPAEGVMEKTVEVNESRTVEGVTITLERVEMSALETKAYAFVVPPGYSPTQVPRPDIEAEGEHSVDGGAMVGAGEPKIRFLENGVELVWDMLAPVPKSGKELTFTVLEFMFEDERWKGPWEFRVSLQ